MFLRLAALFLAVASLTCPVCGAGGVVVIDAGHGGNAPSGSQAARTLSSPNNAVSPSGLQEKNLTLELSQKVIARINKLSRRTGLRAVPTRTGDTNPDFGRRAKVAADHRAAWFVSIHFNAVPQGSRKASGTVGMVQARRLNPHYQQDAALAAALTSSVNQAVRRFIPQSKALSVMDDRGLHGGQGSNLFYQLRRQTKTPVTACFLEVEFIDNPVVEQALLGKNRTAAFDAIAEAIASTLLAQAK